MNAKANILTPATIGAPFEGGFYGGNIRMGDAIYAVCWAPKAQGEIEGAWLGSYTGVPGACSCFDSMANTLAMAEAGSELAGLTQTQAAELVHMEQRGWARWESGERGANLAAWELFLLRVGQHPTRALKRG